MIKITDLVFRRRPFIITNAFLIILIINLSGWATDKAYEINLMPAPDVYEKGLIDPFSDRNPLKAIPCEGILYATDRQPSDAELLIWTFPADYIQKLGAVLQAVHPELSKGLKKLIDAGRCACSTKLKGAL